MKLDLTGKRVVITGASSGLGEHFAHTLSRAGASLGLLARRKEKLKVVAADLQSINGSKTAIAVCDITEASAVSSALQALHSELGGIDVLVNNAGITNQAPALEMDVKDWDKVIATNLRGSWLAATETARLMVADGTPGSVINIASILGVRIAGQVAPYAISKAGVVQMTKALALEWARHDIRVNSLAPGYFATDINKQFFAGEAGRKLISRVPQRRIGELSELDGPLLLLASDASSFMTGTVIPVDGGHLVSSL